MLAFSRKGVIAKKGQRRNTNGIKYMNLFKFNL